MKINNLEDLHHGDARSRPNVIIALNVITFGPKCNKPSIQSFNYASALLLKRTFPLRCQSDRCCTEEPSDQYLCHIAGSLI